MTTPSDWTSYLDSGSHWNVQPGGTITYSFYETGSSLYGATPTGISELPDAVKANIVGIMSAMERFLNVDFVQVADSSSSYGQLRFMNDTEAGYGYAYYPSSWGSNVAGDVHLDPDYNNTGLNGWASAPGNHGYQAIWHEVGHALGLKHPFSGSTQAPADLDNFNHTTMTYNFAGGSPTSWMPGDIYALQQIYGANTTWATGDTTYGFSQTDWFTDGTQSYGAASSNALAVIWDGGGNDTVDLSALSSNGLRIDLTPGTGVIADIAAYNAKTYSDQWGNVEPGTFQLTSSGTFIAYGTTIENAVGSSGSDIIIGNAVDNNLAGGAGADEIHGDAGADTLLGGDGNDWLYGDSGRDQINGQGGNDWIDDGDGDGLVWGASGNDTIYGGVGNDLLNGNMDADAVYGGAGEDQLWGAPGDDQLDGGDGTDFAHGGKGNDTLLGGGGSDTLQGGENNDLLTGGAGNDRLIGGLGKDTLTGGLEADTFLFQSHGANDADTITDYGHGIDDIVLDATVFLALADSVGESLAAANFLAAPNVSAQTTTQFVLYDTLSGNLYFDADASGPGAASLTAMLTGQPVLDATDFVIG